MFQTFGHSVFSLCSWKQASACGTEHCPRVPILLPRAFCGNEWLLVSTAHCPGSHVRGTSGAPSGESRAAHPPASSPSARRAGCGFQHVWNPTAPLWWEAEPTRLFFKALGFSVPNLLHNRNAIKDAPGNLVTVFNVSLLPSWGARKSHHWRAVSICFTRFTHFQVPDVAASMHAQQYNLYGKWDRIMASLNVMAALKGDVTVNSRQIMDRAAVSQLHWRQIALGAIATGTSVSYEEGGRPDAGLFVSSLGQGCRCGVREEWPSVALGVICPFLTQQLRPQEGDFSARFQQHLHTGSGNAQCPGSDRPRADAAIHPSRPRRWCDFTGYLLLPTQRDVRGLNRPPLSPHGGSRSKDPASWTAASKLQCVPVSFILMGG